MIFQKMCTFVHCSCVIMVSTKLQKRVGIILCYLPRFLFFYCTTMISIILYGIYKERLIRKNYIRETVKRRKNEQYYKDSLL